MVSFFKTFAQGVLYVVLLPVFLIIWALYAVYCLIMFIYMAIRNIIIFFSGGTPLGDMKEDVEAKRILLERQQAKQASQNIYISPNSQVMYQQPVREPEPVEDLNAYEDDGALPIEDDQSFSDVEIEEEKDDDYVN